MSYHLIKEPAKSSPMIGENRQLGTYEPVECENNQLKFKTSGKLPIISEEFCKIYPNLIKENRRM